jgi:hypothetical protein
MEALVRVRLERLGDDETVGREFFLDSGQALG